MVSLELDDLWTVDQAAKHARVKPVTIRQWVNRGHLPVADRINGRLRFRPVDVARAEFKTREHARRPAPRVLAA
jgi:DNA-binding transcriptional MerR regulator